MKTFIVEQLEDSSWLVKNRLTGESIDQFNGRHAEAEAVADARRRNEQDSEQAATCLTSASRAPARMSCISNVPAPWFAIRTERMPSSTDRGARITSASARRVERRADQFRIASFGSTLPSNVLTADDFESDFRVKHQSWVVA